MSSVKGVPLHVRNSEAQIWRQKARHLAQDGSMSPREIAEEVGQSAITVSHYLGEKELTARNLEILWYVGQGLDQREIAKAIETSIGNVKRQLSRVFRLLDLGLEVRNKREKAYTRVWEEELLPADGSKPLSTGARRRKKRKRS